MQLSTITLEGHTEQEMKKETAVELGNKERNRIKRAASVARCRGEEAEVRNADRIRASRSSPRERGCYFGRQKGRESRQPLHGVTASSHLGFATSPSQPWP